MYEYSSYFKPFFTLWETVLLKWERCNVLDNSGEVLVRPLKPIRKFTFGYLMNLKEKQFKKLARGLIYNCMIYLQGGELDLKSMHEFTKVLKEVMIRNEIMNFFGAPKPIINNQKPYTDED